MVRAARAGDAARACGGVGTASKVDKQEKEQQQDHHQQQVELHELVQQQEHHHVQQPVDNVTAR